MWEAIEDVARILIGRQAAILCVTSLGILHSEHVVVGLLNLASRLAWIINRLPNTSAVSMPPTYFCTYSGDFKQLAEIGDIQRLLDAPLAVGKRYYAIDS